MLLQRQFLKNPNIRSVNLLRFQSIWAGVKSAPPDKILGLNALYAKDKNPLKIDLGVGAYRDDKGRPWILDSIKMAEAQFQKIPLRKEYLPIMGSPNFIQSVQELIFGHDTYGLNLLSNRRIVTAQGLSGTGSLRVLGEFLKFVNPDQQIALPTPTWANHRTIMERAGLKVLNYKYYDVSQNDLDINGMLSDLNNLKDGSAVLFHLCCHNPTGVDIPLHEWDQIIDILSKKSIILMLDLAYQGFSSGNPFKDLAPLHKLNEAVQTGKLSTLLLAQSFAKNMGLYGERVGSLSIVCANSNEAGRVKSQLASIIRSIYSSPPCHGSQLVEIVLNDPVIYEQWLKDVHKMAKRLSSMRMLLYKQLSATETCGKWDYLLKQHGMFSYSGLSPSEVTTLREKRSIYMTSDGRISLSGIRPDNVNYLARAINKVKKKQI